MLPPDVFAGGCDDKFLSSPSLLQIRGRGLFADDNDDDDEAPHLESVQVPHASRRGQSRLSLDSAPPTLSEPTIMSHPCCVEEEAEEDGQRSMGSSDEFTDETYMEVDSTSRYSN